MLWQGHCSASPARYTHTAYPVACGGGGGFVRTYTRCSLVLARVTCAGWFGRNVCFVVAAHLFHCLSRVVRESSCEPCSCRCPHHQLGLAPGCVQVLHDDGVAYRAALLFCLTPAGVFMSALYSERCAALASWARYTLAMRDRFRWLPPSLFSMLSFAGVLALCRQFHYPRQGSRLLVVHRSPPSTSAAPWPSKLYRGPWPAACCFALATAARSNGIVLCGSSKVARR